MVSSDDSGNGVNVTGTIIVTNGIGVTVGSIESEED